MVSQSQHTYNESQSLQQIEEELDSILTPGKQNVDRDAEGLEIDEPTIYVPPTEQYGKLKELE